LVSTSPTDTSIHSLWLTLSHSGLLPGDGIGREVIPAGRKILEALPKSLGLNFSFVHLDAGFDEFKKNGVALPEKTVETLKKECDGALFGAVRWAYLIQARSHAVYYTYADIRLEHTRSLLTLTTAAHPRLPPRATAAPSSASASA
jgi:isocitrate/isopropylmalate dehydrogenase